VKSGTVRRITRATKAAMGGRGVQRPRARGGTCERTRDGSRAVRTTALGKADARTLSIHASSRPVRDAATAMHEIVQNYYGKQLTKTSDLATDACCTVDSVPEHVKPLLARIHPEVSSRYYGCGLIAPDLLEGLSVLDLGSGAGQDCFVLSALVGESGSVVGVDMTDEQLAVAERHIEYHREQNGYARANVRFVKGYLEQLESLDLEPGSFDLIVSNCVLNLTTDKAAVLRAAHRLLRPGGEMYFSDVYSERRVPQALLDDPLLYGECLSGALYWNDFLTLAKDAGFPDVRLVTDRPLGIQNREVQAKLAGIAFHSATYRLFKLDGLEPACEDYGQAVVYLGTIPGAAHEFAFDSHHVMERGKVFPVCGNTWRMLHDTRFAEHFQFIGDFSTHYGIFEGCGVTSPFSGSGERVAASAPTAAPKPTAANKKTSGGCC
jgi:arsenite methyltransferase